MFWPRWAAPPPSRPYGEWTRRYDANRVNFCWVLLNGTYLAQNRHLDRLQELDISHNAIAAIELAYASGVLPYREFVQENRIPTFENLNVPNACVCYVCVYT